MPEKTTPYPGINAHLNNYLLQPDGGWEMFHAEHIIAIRQLLDTILPPNYYAASEKSLQVAAVEESPAQRTIPDVGVYQTHEGNTGILHSEATAPTAILPIDDTVLHEETEPNAVTIYRFDEGRIPGTLVTRLEVLSPANKPGGSHYRRYLQRRHETLHGHVNLVEIDYLPNTHPIVRAIPSYPRRESDATPYYVLVSIPYPSVEEGTMQLYAIPVDQALPRLKMPLSGNTAITLDLQAAYTQTIDNARVFRMLADTSKPLSQPDQYSDSDQECIQKLVAAFTNNS